MHLLECVFTLEHCTALRLLSSPFRAILLLSFSSPVVGSPFYMYRERARGRLVLEAGLEESRVWL